MNDIKSHSRDHIKSKRLKLSKSIVAMGFDLIESSSRLYSRVKTTPSWDAASDVDFDVASDVDVGVDSDSSKRTRSWSAFTRSRKFVTRPIITWA